MICEEEGIKFEIDIGNRSAKVIGCSNKVENAYIPRFIQYGSQEYPIKIISKEAFKKSSVTSIDFPEDSELQKIESNAFGNSIITKLYIPSNVVELDEGWCQDTGKKIKITISPKNEKFTQYNEDLIIGKSDIQSDNFDILYFANREIEQIDIPPFIKKINSYALSECDNLIHVKIPENSELEFIGDFAFRRSTIARIFIPKHVKVIGKGAFSQCTNLYKINLDQNSELQSIEEDAFEYTNIEDLYLPASLKELKGGWCHNLPYLQTFSISPNNKYFSVFEGKMIVGKSNPNDEVYDTLYLVQRNIANVVVPSFIKKINGYAFDNCQSVKTVKFSEDSQLEIIGKYAFTDSNITSISIPKSVTTIDERAFFKCINLYNVTFEEGSKLTVIGKAAFKKSDIENICIPKHVKMIDEKAFMRCLNLKEVTFEKDTELKTIGVKSFAKTLFSKFTIPKSVEFIEENAFYDCKKLENVLFEDQSNLKMIKKSAFFKSKITELKLPASIETLEQGWCQYTNNLYEVDFAHPNPHFRVLDNKIILRKSSELNATNNNDDDYDVICFVPRYLENVIVPSYVKVIDSFAFSGCTKLKQVTFEEESKLEKISVESFSYSSLTAICIPKSVEIIDDLAFAECKKLKNLTIQDDSKLQLIGAKAFFMTSIKSIKIPNTVKEIKEKAFLMCEKLKSFEFADGCQIQCISKDMLSNTSIKEIAIPNSVKSINEAAFFQCYNLEKVDISDDSELTTIESIAFSDCSIKKFYIPPLVNIINWNSLSTDLTEITISPNNKYWSVINNNTIIVCKSDTNSDKYDTVLYALRSIKKAIIPSYIKKIEPKAFIYSKKLHVVEFTPDSELEIIGKNSFQSSGLTSISIPDTVKVIDDFAFANCVSFKYIRFTENSKIEIIGKRAFSGTPLLDFSVLKTVKTIGNDAFAPGQFNNSTSVKIEFSKDSLLQKINNGSFENCKNVSINIPKHVKEIDHNAFINSSLVNVTFPEDSMLQKIGNHVFSGSKLSSINFPSQLKELGKFWARGIGNLTSISISPQNKHFKFIDEKIIAYRSDINNGQFYDTIIVALRNIEHAVIPSYIKKINPYAFANCKYLKSIEFQENSNLEIIDDYAFYKTLITNVIIPKSVKIIGIEAFHSNSIQSITFQENSNLNSIRKNAFESTDIKEFMFPNNNNDLIIGLDVFKSCDKLENIVLSENISSVYTFQRLQIEKINIPSKVDDLHFIDMENLTEIHISHENKLYRDIDGKMILKKSNANINGNDDDAYDTIYKSLTSIEHVKIPSYIKTIKGKAFKSCKNIVSFEFAENSQLNVIENYAFQESSINEIKIPKNTEFIGIEAFYNCHSLQTVIFEADSKLKKIEALAFADSSIESICIPRHVKVIDVQAFDRCTSLKEVTFEKDSELKIIESQSFGDNKIKSIIIPKSVESIENRAFIDCDELETVIFEEGSKLKVIHDRAFCCTKIKVLNLPGTIEKLEPDWCGSMKSLVELNFIPPNPRFKTLDNKVILGQSKYLDIKANDTNDVDGDDNNEGTFDVIFFTPRKMTQISIPSYIKYIYYHAFSNSRKLEIVKFEKDSKLVEIFGNAFSNSSIKSIVIPKNVDYIGEYCFSNCKMLESIEFDPDSHAFIDDFAFNRTALKGIIIPKFATVKKCHTFNQNINSIEFLGDDVVTDVLLEIDVSILSFPNAHNVVFSSIDFYNDNNERVRIYVLAHANVEFKKNSNRYNYSNYSYGNDYDDGYGNHGGDDNYDDDDDDYGNHGGDDNYDDDDGYGNHGGDDDNYDDDDDNGVDFAEFNSTPSDDNHY